MVMRHATVGLLLVLAVGCGQPAGDEAPAEPPAAAPEPATPTEPAEPAAEPDSAADGALLQIEAPETVCWHATVDMTTQQDCGNAEYPLEGLAGIHAANAQKRSGGRDPLTLRLLVGGTVVDEATTDAEYGVATVSNQ
jgi:hypothetical protein